MLYQRCVDFSLVITYHLKKYFKGIYFMHVDHLNLYRYIFLITVLLHFLYIYISDKCAVAFLLSCNDPSLLFFFK